MSVKDWVLLGVLALGSFIWWLSRRNRRISGKKVGPSQNKAAQILEEAGYEVLKAKPKVSVKMDIDGKDYPFELTSDLLVKRNGRVFLARIRRDSKTIRLHSKLWRGSLLRDALAFRAGGIVIVHLEKQTLQEVRFKV